MIMIWAIDGAESVITVTRFCTYENKVVANIITFYFFYRKVGAFFYQNAHPTTREGRLKISVIDKVETYFVNVGNYSYVFARV